MTVPSDRIVMMENHDDALQAWRSRGIRGRTLVHVDAHIDFGWVPECDFDEIVPAAGTAGAGADGRLLLNPYLKPRSRMVDIGNYICPAMREGIVDTFYWVVPDESWRDRRGRRHIARYFRHLGSLRGRPPEKPRFYRDHARCRFLEKDVIVCSLENLPALREPVLLDIDTDFLVTPRIWDDLNPARMPWLSPESLHTKIAEKITAIDTLTIAYSVEGGFTPIGYKYLGDEVRSSFEEDPPEEERARRDRVRKAREAFEAALRELRDPAGDPARAAQRYAEALRWDTTYGTAYNNHGILYMRYNDPARAEREYRRFLRLDDGNAAVLSGLGFIALSRRRYAEALGYFDRSLARDGKRIGGRMGKAITLFQTGRFGEAAELFTGLAAEAPDNAEVRWWLGRIAERRGARDSAIGHYKDAVLYGGEGPAVHLRLARLYLRQRMWFRAREELGRFFGMLI